MVASTAATAITTSNERINLAFQQGVVTIQPGLYFEGFTGNASTLQLSGAAGDGSDRYGAFLGQDSATASTGGAAPAAIRTPKAQITAGLDNTTLLPFFYLTQFQCPASGCQ